MATKMVGGANQSGCVLKMLRLWSCEQKNSSTINPESKKWLDWQIVFSFCFLNSKIFNYCPPIALHDSELWCGWFLLKGTLGVVVLTFRVHKLLLSTCYHILVLTVHFLVQLGEFHAHQNQGSAPTVTHQTSIVYMWLSHLGPVVPEIAPHTSTPGTLRWIKKVPTFYSIITKDGNFRKNVHCDGLSSFSSYYTFSLKWMQTNRCLKDKRLVSKSLFFGKIVSGWTHTELLGWSSKV